MASLIPVDALSGRRHFSFLLKHRDACQPTTLRHEVIREGRIREETDGRLAGPVRVHDRPIAQLGIASSDGQAALTPNAAVASSAILIALVKARIIFREFMEVRHAPVLLGLLTGGRKGRKGETSNFQRVRNGTYPLLGLPLILREDFGTGLLPDLSTDDAAARPPCGARSAWSELAIGEAESLAAPLGATRIPFNGLLARRLERRDRTLRRAAGRARPAPR